MYDPIIRIYYNEEAIVFTSADRIENVVSYIRERQPGVFCEYRARMVEQAYETCRNHKAWGVSSLFCVFTRGLYGVTDQISQTAHPEV
jgi:hypothetical protein